jgi:hypothetical protein
MNRWRQEVKYGRRVPLSPDNLFSGQPETNVTESHLAVYQTELVFRPHTKYRSLLDLGLRTHDWQYQSKMAKSRFNVRMTVPTLSFFVSLADFAKH